MVVQSFAHPGRGRRDPPMVGKVLAAQYPVPAAGPGCRSRQPRGEHADHRGDLRSCVAEWQGEVTVGAIVTFCRFSMQLIGRMEQFAGFISSLFFQTHLLKGSSPCSTRRRCSATTRPLPAAAAGQGRGRVRRRLFGYEASHSALEAPAVPRTGAGGTAAIVARPAPARRPH